MKIFIITILFIISSCSFYMDTYEVVLNGVGSGRLVLSSDELYSERRVVSGKVFLEIKKGILYTVLFYPDFYCFESRYPLGAVLYPGERSIELKAELGSFAIAANCLHRTGFNLSKVKLDKLTELLNEEKDTWRFVVEDIVLYLKGELTLSGIDKKRIINIPEISEYINWIPENKLFEGWYPSVQTFKNPQRDEFLRIEIFENGNYNYFIYVN